MANKIKELADLVNQIVGLVLGEGISTGVKDVLARYPGIFV